VASRPDRAENSLGDAGTLESDDEAPSDLIFGILVLDIENNICGNISIDS
jgi:hypothetical protein